MRHYQRFAPALDLGAELYGRLVTPYEGFDEENAAVAGPLQAELGRVLGARSTLDHWRYIRSFEAEFAAWCGRRFCVGLGSGTAALELALVAMGVGPGDEVITSAHTFIATALAVHHAGAKLVLVDPDPSDLCLRAEAVARAITPRTKLILPVHMHGHLAELPAILALARARGLAVLEDCAQAAGAAWGEQPVPIGGHGCFSFYPSKPLGGLGNGGCFVTDDPALAAVVERLRDPDGADPLLLRAGRTPSFLHPVDVALLRCRLPLMGQRQAARAARAAVYQRALADPSALRPQPGVRSAWASFVIRRPDRDAVRARLLRAGFEAKVEYEVPLMESPSLRPLGLEPAAFPVALQAAREGLSLPTRPSLSLQAAARLAAAVGPAAGARSRFG